MTTPTSGAPNGTVVLAYSGGLDTSALVPWLKEKYGYDVVCCLVDIGRVKDVPEIMARAEAAGAIAAVAIDAKEEFAEHHCLPALMANALYEGKYPLSTALGRPLIAKKLVETAHKYGATAVAHGCTGKGNDQVRIDIGVQALDPTLEIIAPPGPRLAEPRRSSSTTSPRTTSRSTSPRRARTPSTRTCGAAATSAASSRTRGSSRRRTPSSS